MDFALSSEQELLKNEARQFLDTECPKKVIKQIEESEPGYSPEIWKKMAGLGWLGLVLPEEYGGVNGSLLDLAVLFEELGKTALPRRGIDAHTGAVGARSRLQSRVHQNEGKV